MEINKNNNRGLIWLIIILIILVLGLAGYIVYDKVSNENPKQNNSMANTETNEETNSNDDIEKYLSYVPMESDYTFMCLERSNPDNIEICQNRNKYLDAYSKSKITVQDINDELLIRMGIFKTENVSSTDAFEYNFEFCGENQSCIASEYYKGENVKNKLYEMYNKNVELKEVSVGGGYAYYVNGYYALYYGRGNFRPQKLNKVINYEYKDNDLIILEQAIFMYDFLGEIDITKSTNYDTQDLLKTADLSTAEEYAKNNLNNSNIFKHTFKLNKNGNYYWYSTELYNN